LTDIAKNIINYVAGISKRLTYGFIHFSTVTEADAAKNKGSVVIAGAIVTLAAAKTPKNKDPSGAPDSFEASLLVYHLRQSALFAEHRPHAQERSSANTFLYLHIMCTFVLHSLHIPGFIICKSLSLSN
jgi:hypothetical protein